MTKKVEFDCSAEKLTEKVEHYFTDCDENSRKPTAPGLCFSLGITVEKFMNIINGVGKSQSEHAKILKMAQLRLIDDIEQRTDSMSVSRAKLPVYSLRGGEAEGGVTVKLALGGMKKGDEPFD